jgi:hypothetical protein
MRHLSVVLFAVSLFTFVTSCATRSAATHTGEDANERVVGPS